MHLRLFPTGSVWSASALIVVLGIVFSSRLLAATVVTGDVSPGLPWTSSTNSGVGITGTGTLTVDEGDHLSSNSSILGVNSGSMGSATITGAGSKWTNASFLYVGKSGSGSLTVADGGQVTAGTLYASLSDLHGNGTIAATTGAVLDADLRFNAAHPAQDILGFGTGGVLTVTAAGGDLGVGYKGTGSLSISEGAAISSLFGVLGLEVGSSGAATITGAGSKWINSSFLFVGWSGSGSLTVADGGQVTAGTLYASLSDLHGNGTIAATTGAVLDANLKFNAAHPAQDVLGFGVGGVLTVTAAGGHLGAGHKSIGTLTISEGAAVSSFEGRLGENAGSTGTARITGDGSKWTNDYNLYVGDSGSGALHVEAGGQVSSSFGVLGSALGSQGTASVTGAGSTWTTSLTLYVGDAGSGELRVEDGGLVRSSAYGTLGNRHGSKGTATITGVRSRWTHDAFLYVGDSGSGALRVENGGEVSSLHGNLGANSGSTGEATVTGPDSKWTTESSLNVGIFGRGELTITEGGLVSVGGTLSIDYNNDADSFINLASGGMLAVRGDADDSLSQLLDLVEGTDAIRYWNAGLARWTPLTDAALGADFSLQYQSTGDLTGYTLVTVHAPGPSGDYNGDGRVDGGDLLAWQRGESPISYSPMDLATWKANFDIGASISVTTPVSEPGTLAMAGVAVAKLLLGCRSARSRTYSARLLF